jgi:hypothetical protein
MKAIVCDCCGKVMLLESQFRWPETVYTLSKGGSESDLDLCKECAENLTKAIRKGVGEDG